MMVRPNLLRLCAIALLVLFSAGLSAQEKGGRAVKKAEFPVYYRVGSDRIDPDYRDNSSAINRLTKMFENPDLQINRVVMAATTSPEGTTKYNMSLARRRADAFASYFNSLSTLGDIAIESSTSLFSWKDLAMKVAKDTVLANRDEVLEILGSAAPESMVSALKRLDNGKTYKYLDDEYLSDMRSSGCLLVYYTNVREQTEMLLDALKFNPELVSTLREEILGMTTKDKGIKVPYPAFAFRTNLLLPLSNIGFEIPVSNKFSVSADFYTPWIPRNANHRNCFQMQGINADIKYWFGESHSFGNEYKKNRLTGHAIGLFGYAGQYDFERKYHGKQGEFIATGLEYTYSLANRKSSLRWNFTIGAGYLHHQYYEYDVYNEGGELFTRKSVQDVNNRLAPLKAEVSLVIPIMAHYTISTPGSR